MKNKRILIIFLNLLLLSVLLLSSCEGEKRKLLDSGDCGKDVVWEFYDDGTLVLSGTGEMYNLGESGAQWKKNEEEILYIAVEDGVTQICDKAFSGLPYLRSTEIADSVTEIGSRAFADCPCLTTVRLPGMLETLKSGIFSGCKTLADIELPQTLLHIEDSVFAQCANLKDIALPGGVQSVGDRAFENCSSLESIVIPKSVPAVEYASFQNCVNLQSVTILEGVEQIENFAFENCSNLKSIVIPGSVSVIGMCSFQNCVNLQSVTISEGVEHIESFAFENCSNLERVVIPDTLNTMEEAKDHSFNTREIAKGRFRGCSKLAKVSFNDKTFALRGKSYRDLLNEFGEPSKVEIKKDAFYNETLVYFDQDNFYCQFVEDLDENYLPNTYCYPLNVFARLGYIVEGLEDGAYTYGELMPVFSAAGAELIHGSWDYGLGAEPFYSGSHNYVKLNNGYEFVMISKDQNLITFDSSEYVVTNSQYYRW